MEKSIQREGEASAAKRKQRGKIQKEESRIIRMKNKITCSWSKLFYRTHLMPHTQII